LISAGFPPCFLVYLFALFLSYTYTGRSLSIFFFFLLLARFGDFLWALPGRGAPLSVCPLLPLFVIEAVDSPVVVDDGGMVEDAVIWVSFES
jgi:hypothetical protein